ncbi:YgaP-like transmembrane domain [Pseudomonas lopnurensis]|uniref:YgaP-like transmembrane domain n=1 Tax=Pseudomonas lopnurensis TaxID=1477517 RepID=UPI0028AB7C13|nr:YgaP-like transmembrane domain [Pseudomonas lopnurensis]
MNHTSSNRSAQNVHGWERAVSLAGGLYFLGKGLRRGGLGGLLQLAVGGMALARGVSGHCEAKRVFNEINEQAGMAEGRSHQLPLERSDAEQQQLNASAQAATGSATVVGSDTLKTPPAGV